MRRIRPFKEGFRADIDGITHACGHDGHITIGLAMAKLIVQNLDDFKANLDLYFKPPKRALEAPCRWSKQAC